MKTKVLLSVLLASMLCFSLLGGCVTSGADTDAQSESSQTSATPETTRPTSQPSLEDDYYNHTNYEWLTNTELPADAPAVSAFTQIQDDIDETLRDDLDNMLVSGAANDDANLQKLVDYYALASDYDARNNAGFMELLPLLERIEAYESLEHLSAEASDLILSGYTLPFTLLVSNDPKESSTYALFAYESSLLLGDKSYYDEDKAAGDELLKLYQTYVLKLFELAGYDASSAEEHWAQAMELERALASQVLSAEENANTSITYNPVSFASLSASISHFDLQMIVETLCGQAPEQIIIDNPTYFESLDTLVSESTFAQLKSWIIVRALDSYAGYLNEDAIRAQEELSMAMEGNSEAPSLEKLAYELTSDGFGEILGQYYGETYFGTQAQGEVTKMTEDIIATFRERLIQNTWLTPETIEKALVKLDALQINVGWPTKVSPGYDLLAITPASQGGTFFGNHLQLYRTSLTHSYSLLGTAVDRDVWDFGVHKVNAYYSPEANAIYLPAAILNAPFYSIEQSPSQNYGGIGVVIGHEITHAFDPNGSLYDENGNMNNWWTTEDMEQFESRTQAIVDLFDGQEVSGIEINGTLTKTENVADAGGVACALHITQQLDTYSLEEFFENYAAIWRMVETKDYISVKYRVDVHAPGILRVNVQLGNCETFYEVYDIQEGDGMYINPENRVVIW